VSKVDLVILGLVSEKPRHGYDILREIARRDMQHWVGVSNPAIYKGLARLEAKRLISSERVSGDRHPDRTVYALSEDGRSAFRRLLERALVEPQRPHFDFLVGIGFAHLAEKDVLLGHVAARREQLEPLLKLLADHRASFADIGHPFTADEIIGFYEDLVRMELSWLERFRARVEATASWPEGAYQR
jgi:DNA-binding PadR family transcriptional regulator